MSNFVAPSNTDSGASPYRDVRLQFFQRFFERGARYSDYVAHGDPRHRSRWAEFEKKISVSPGDQAIVSTFKRKLNVLVLSGIWCGDCARQGPMLHAIEKAAPVLECRFIDNRENPALQEELRINGAEKVPVVVALSEDFFELGRFGDRHLSVYRRKAISELGPACDAGIVPPSGSELEEEVTEWVEWFERIQILLRLAPMLRRRYGD